MNLVSSTIEKVFQVSEAKTPEDLRAKSLELYQKCLDDARQVYETQVRGFETAVEKWAELTTRVAA